MGEALFAAIDGVHGYELWSTDGTAEGTHLVADINPGPIGVGVFELFATDNGQALFTVNDGTHGFEPWVSDGTADGTHLVADINPGSSSSFAGVGGFANIGDGRILFAASDGVRSPALGHRRDGAGNVFGGRSPLELKQQLSR